MKTRTQKAYGYAILATLCWSTVATAFKKTLLWLHSDTITMLFYSTTVSAVILFILLGFKKKWKTVFHIHLHTLISSALRGFLNPYLYYIILFKAYSLLPGQEAQPLNFTWPIILTLLSIIFLRQKITYIHILALIVSFTGVLIIATRGHILSLRFANLPGALLALGSSLIWATYWLLNIKDKRDAVVKLFTNFFFGFIYILITLIFIKGFILPPLKGFLGTIWIGCFEMGLTFVIWMKALEYTTKTSMVSNIIYLSPFFSLILLNRIAGEKLLTSSVIGLLIIISGILLQSFYHRKETI